MADTKSSLLQEMAHQIAAEDAHTFKIAVVRSGHEAGVLKNLLTHQFRYRKNDIAELGYTASDERNAMILRRKNPIVIVPDPILKNRPCQFHPPNGATAVMVFENADEEAAACRFKSPGSPFTIEELSLDLEDLGIFVAEKREAEERPEPAYGFSDLAYPELAPRKSWWRFWS